MRFSLVNPAWNFDRSIYFGCRQPHLPLELRYSQMLLNAAGHEAEIIDGQLENLTLQEIANRVKRFRPDFAVVTSAPSYLFWRCAPPELRAPREVMDAIRDQPCKLVAIGPHASTTPQTTLEKLGAEIAIMGECEEILPRLAGDLGEVPSICYRTRSGVRTQGLPHASNMAQLPALSWDWKTVARHSHHHHRFDAEPQGPGAEMETSRGCPYHCTFCAKDNFRNSFRRRPIDVVAQELDGLIEAGVDYVYFIDEIFLPYRNVLETIAERRIKFGIQTRIDLWSFEMLDLLGKAGCVSIEAGVESITEEGRDILDKKCKLSTSGITDRLVYAKQRVPFVQANLLDSKCDDLQEVERWREYLQTCGVWANKPVPLFAYPGSPDYTRRWGTPDEQAWERAHDDYLKQFAEFSDIQEQHPLPLVQLEGLRH
jgi:B12-binding domain/radical SAM domain protein of rhizo-twelve system